MTKRLWINLVAFSAVFALLLSWAVQNVFPLEFIERPYKVTAEFTTSPGFRSGFEVSYLGVRIGKLGKVEMVGDHVVVELKINRDVKLPANVEAAVRRKSAVGEPYVDLSPTGGVDPGGPRLEAGTVITREHTSTPVSYSELFTAVDALLGAVPPDDFGRLIHSLAVGFEGRADDIRTIITSVDGLTTKLVDNAPLLDQIATDLTRLTHTISEHRDTIGQSWNNLGALSEMLAASKDNLIAALDNTPTLGQQFDSLLSTSGRDISCIFDAAAGIWSHLDGTATLEGLSLLVDKAGMITDVIRGLYFNGPDGPYLNGTFILNVGGITPVTRYEPPHELPPAPEVPGCNADAQAGAGAPTAGTGAGGQTPPGAGTSAVEVPDREHPAVVTPESSKRPPDKGIDFRDLARKATFAAAVIGLLLLIGATRPWRFVIGRRNHE